MSKDRKHLKEARTTLLDGISVPQTVPFVADSFQIDAVSAVERGEDTLVIAPTGTGKTYIAIEGIRRAVLQKKRAIYTAPLKALSNTKYAELKKLFEPEHRVGLLTGDRKIDTDADVVVATTEIYRNDLYNYGADYSLVVLDELHYLADPQRGPVWEESIILSPPTATLLMLSASISNPEEIADWIKQVRGRDVTIIKQNQRPVELRLAFLHPELGILPLENAKGKVLPEISQFYGESGGKYRRKRGGNSRKGGADKRQAPRAHRKGKSS